MPLFAPSHQDPNNCYFFHDREEGEAIEVEVYYSRSSLRHRGIYVSIKPVTVSEGLVSFNMLGGYSRRICSLQRAAPRVLKQVVKAAEATVAELAETYRRDPSAGKQALDAFAQSLEPAAA
jgi:hypothetical protein